MSGSDNWDALPNDLKYREQWCIAAPDKSPFSTAGYNASVNDPSQWTDWYSASTVAAQWGNGAGIGFVLTEQDEFTCIDLDVKDDTTPERLAQFHNIIATFDSYTEHSKSGKGYHIWVRGKVGQGARRDGIEVYSQQRFIICTGNVVVSKPVEPRQHHLEQLVQYIRDAQGHSGSDIALVEVTEVDSDQTVYERARDAGNGAKFVLLWTTPYSASAEHPSQSEADLALMSMLAFYSKSNEQCRRLFRLSELGKREKATKNNRYLDYTLKLIRARQAREAAAQELDAQRGNDLAASMMAKLNAKAAELPVPPSRVEGLLQEVSPDGIDYPPGPIGEIAKWMYSIAPRPVKEVAIVSALGVFAGIMGRAYNISNSGLNLYIVLVARSAVGKEAIHSGISKLLGHVMNSVCPAMGEFVEFADFASGPALIKAFGERHSFVNVAGEWGRKLKRMADDNDVGPMASLRTTMTNLYQKSSAGTIVGGIGYSDKDKDIKSINGIAYSMIGETTPETFYESLTNTMMQDGFMSRFVVFEYNGLRQTLNPMQNTPPPDWTANYFFNLVSAVQAQVPGTVYDIATTHDAQDLLDAFNLKCDTQINSTNDESWRQMWNRAHLKALKIAGLLGAAENFAAPLVRIEHAQWALECVERDIRIMSHKMTDGDVGDGDIVRERKILSILKTYMQTPIPKGYQLPDEMRTQGIIARKFLQNKLQRVNSFIKHPLGHLTALEKSIKNLVENGYLAEVPKDKLPADWGSVGRCYRILMLPNH